MSNCTHAEVCQDVAEAVEGPDGMTIDLVVAVAAAAVVVVAVGTVVDGFGSVGQNGWARSAGGAGAALCDHNHFGYLRDACVTERVATTAHVMVTARTTAKKPTSIQHVSAAAPPVGDVNAHVHVAVLMSVYAVPMQTARACVQLSTSSPLCL